MLTQCPNNTFGALICYSILNIYIYNSIDYLLLNVAIWDFALAIHIDCHICYPKNVFSLSMKAENVLKVY